MINARRVDDIVREVCLELGQASAMFPEFNSPHEGYAVLKEEVDELWDAIKHNDGAHAQKQEAIQVAAMAIRFIYDLIVEDRA